MTSAAEIVAAIDEDLVNLQDPRVRDGIEAFRSTPPTPIRLAWDFGEPGETFDGWLVFDDPAKGAGIVYCDRGFGPKHPWGLVFTGKPTPSMGEDTGWFGRFVDAYFESFSATDLPIWRVVRRAKRDSTPEPVTGELPWEEAWKTIYQLREADSAHVYDCEHDVSY